MMETSLAQIFADERPTELIGGRIVAMASPTPYHNRIVVRIVSIFENFLRNKSCIPFGDNTSVFLSETERYVPDAMIVCDKNKIKLNGIHGAPDLVVEVLSPSTAKYDRGHKKDVYEQAGVREYWIANPGDNSLEQYILADGRFTLQGYYHYYSEEELEYMEGKEREKIIWEFPCNILQDLTIPLAELFANLL